MLTVHSPMALLIKILNLGEFEAKNTFFCETQSVVSEDICVDGHISSC